MQYTKPPLPFMGNKKNMLKHIKEVLENMVYAGSIIKARNECESEQSTIFYDVFGGSGLVSHFVKQMFPYNRVVWNDFDNYKERLEHITETESIRQEITKILLKYDKTKDEKITPAQIAQIKEVLDRYEYLDYITLSSFLCFAGNYCLDRKSLYDNIKYNRLSYTPLNAQGYLSGVERVSLEFKDLLDSIPQEQKDAQLAFLILDPPYLQTQKGSYNDAYTLKDFCFLVEHIFKPYLFFSSENSDILAFLEFYKKYNKVFEGYAFNQAYLQTLGGKNAKTKLDYIIYDCKQKGLFEDLA